MLSFRWWTAAPCLLLALCSQPVPAQTGEKQAPDFEFDPADRHVDAAVLPEPLRYDGDVAVLAGTLWYTWLELAPGKGDQIWVGVREDDGWSVKRRVTGAHGEYARPTLTVDRDQLWLSYEQRRGDQWDVLAVPLREGRPSSEALQVSSGEGADINHAAAAGPGGGLWIVWQSDRGGQFDVLARRIASGRLEETFTVGDHPAGDWHPRVAVDGAGVVYCAWDAYDGDAFNVHLRVRRDGRWGSIVEVTGGTAFEGRAEIVSRGASGAFLAWESGGANWGKPFRGLLTPLLRDHHGPLHRYRHLHIATVSPDGRVEQLEQALPMPSVGRAARRPGISPEGRRLGAFYERARMTVDGGGRLWVFYRHFYTPWLGAVHRSHIEEGWGVYARYLGADGWSELFRTRVGQGDGMQRLALAADGDAVHAVWTAGRTHRQTSDRPRGLVMATVHGSGAAATAPPSRPVSPAARTGAPRGRTGRPSPVEVAGKSYQLFYGDLHRHTDLSLCRVPIDGTIDDAYRYASEVAQLDFLGITDHTRDIAKGDPLSLLWWRCRKEVLRHQLGAPGARAFVPFYSYERSHGNTADHNVISLRPDLLRPYTYPVPEFWKELDRDTMTIAHQPIRRDTWNYQNDGLRPLVEIFQGARDRSIEEDVHRGLAKGYHLGFIASSDHMSTSASYACVWAERATRESIFRALQARRTFGATARIRLRVQAGPHWMGEIVKAKRMPPLILEARGTAPIRSVNLVIDGRVHETVSPNRPHVRLRRELDLQGTHYVYFHLVQADGNEAWSSPLWVGIPSAG